MPVNKIIHLLYKYIFHINILKFKQFNFRESWIISYNSRNNSLAWAISYDFAYFIDGENGGSERGYDLSRLQD